MSRFAAPLLTPEPFDAIHLKREDRKGLHGRLVHDRFWLGLLVRGTGYYRIGPDPFPPDRPLAYFIPAGEEDVAGLDGPVESWGVSFRWSGLQADVRSKEKVRLRWSGRELLLPRWKRISSTALARLIELNLALRVALQRQDTGGYLLSRGLLLELFTAYAELPGREAPTPGEQALERFHALLQERACDPVRLEQLAGEAGLTAGHLRQLFRVRYQMRPAEYRNRLRLARARELLASGRIRIKEAARIAGFSDPLYFSKVFKKAFGVPPRHTMRRPIV